jgi:GMP synthase (glutamine-hydrolysing)
MDNQASILLVVCQPDEAWEKYGIGNDKRRIADALGWPADTPRIRAISAITQELPQDFPESAVIVGPSRHMLNEDLPWMHAAKDFIRRTYEQGKPMLGLCFGQQIICETLGGTVGPSERPEKGMIEVSLTDEGKDDPLFAGLDATFQAAAHHSNGVKTLPQVGDVRVLASNANEPYQALAIGNNIRTVQFHPDTNADEIIRVLQSTKQKLLESGYFKNADEADEHVAEIKRSQINKSRQVLRNFIKFFAQH